MSQAQRDILDGHTIAELAVLLVDLQYNQHNIHSSNVARRAGVTPLIVAQHIVHRLVLA